MWRNDNADEVHRHTANRRTFRRHGPTRDPIGSLVATSAIVPLLAVTALAVLSWIS